MHLCLSIYWDRRRYIYAQKISRPMPTLAYYRHLGFCLNLCLLCKTEVEQAGPLIFSKRIFPFTSDLEKSVAIFSTDPKALKQLLNIV